MELRQLSHSAPRGVTAAVLWLLALGSSSAQGQTQRPTEYEVKAVYLYNFAKFVRWPAGAPVGEEDAFTICVLGDDPFGPILDRTLAGETLDGKRTAVRRIERVGEAGGCRIVFISASEERRLTRILAALEDQSLLTVSDMDDFSTRGGMIQLVLDEDRVRFEVNLTAATRAGLDLSSELLKVARKVMRESSRMLRRPVLVALRLGGVVLVL